MPHDDPQTAVTPSTMEGQAIQKTVVLAEIEDMQRPYDTAP